MSTRLLVSVSEYLLTPLLVNLVLTYPSASRNWVSSSTEMFCEFCSVWQVWGEHCAGHWESVSNMSWKTQQNTSNSKYVICTQQDTTLILQTQDTSSAHNRIPPRYFKLKIRHLYTTGYHPKRHIVETCTRVPGSFPLAPEASTNDMYKKVSV